MSPQVQAAYNALLSQFGGVSSGTNAATTGATAGLGSLAANSNPAFASAAGTLGSAAAPAYASISNYLSPYLTGALQTQMASQNQQNAQQQQGVVGDAIAKGALGGNRVAVAQGELAGQQAIANNAANSGLINSAYQQAENAALAGQQGQTAAGSAQAGLGGTQTAASLSALLGQLQGGNSQFSNLNTLAGAASGLSNTGATTTTTGSGSATQPGGNWLSSLLGAGLSIAGMFRDGGVVPHFDAGGMVGMMAAERAAQLADVMGRTQQGLTPPSNDNQANDNLPGANGIGGMGSQAQQQKGATGIKNWLSSAMSPAATSGGGGLGPIYANGGVVARGYDGGGYVDPYYPSAYAGMLQGLTPPGLDALSNGSGVVPAAPRNVVAPAIADDAPSNVVPFRSQDIGVPTDAGMPYTPSLPQGVSHVDDQGFAAPAPVPRAPVAPIAPAPSGVVPLAPLPSPAPQSGALSAINRDAPSPAGNSPLTIATNNPGAITDGPWARSMPGYAGNKGDFAVFDSPASGQAAQLHLLNNYVASGHNTIASVINKWAPPAANAPGSTNNYIGYVASRTGLDPNAPIPPEKLPAVAAAQAEWESGLKPGGFTPPAGAPDAMAFSGNGAAPAAAGVVPAAPAFTSGAHGVIPNPGTASGQPGGGIPGGNGITPPGGYGVPDSNAGYSTGIQDSFKSMMAGHGLNLSPDARMGLISAGAGMMAGTSPFALTNVGTGIEQGVKTWQQKQDQNIATARANSDVGAQQGDLSIAGQQLYLNAQKTAADVAQENASAAATGNDYSASPYGLVHINKLTNQVEAVPWGTVISGAGQSPVGSIDPAKSAADATDPQGFIVKAPPMSAANANPMLMNPETAKIVFGQTNDALGSAQQQSIAAQTLDAQIGELASLAKDMPATGALAQGAGFDQRLAAVKTMNAALGTINIAPIDPQDVSTAEGMKKLGTQLQAAVAGSWKSDPAASTILQAGSASPSGENSAAGFSRIVGNIQALNKRAVDRFNYLASWANGHYGDLTGADAAFNESNPPQKYVAYGDKLGQQLANPPGSMGNPITPASQADIDNAPAGSVLSINGKLMRKK